MLLCGFTGLYRGLICRSLLYLLRGLGFELRGCQKANSGLRDVRNPKVRGSKLREHYRE